ncbi:hypothetical protein F4809DRAFT_633110 [Biscogniauxia mediterranea]|nr:hypothetical protein F4809DRAFT_633110 [Biscogniauxia mediterranea]
MHCYCANYYGAINCHNKVTQFGDRCKLCTIMNEGAPANYDVLRFLTDGDFAHEQRTRPERDNSSREERRSRGRDRNSMLRRA